MLIGVNIYVIYWYNFNYNCINISINSIYIQYKLFNHEYITFLKYKISYNDNKKYVVHVFQCIVHVFQCVCVCVIFMGGILIFIYYICIICIHIINYSAPIMYVAIVV